MSYGGFVKIYLEEQLLIKMRDKIFDIAKNQKYVGYPKVLGSFVYKYFDKRSAVCADKSAATCTRTGINCNSKN